MLDQGHMDVNRKFESWLADKVSKGDNFNATLQSKRDFNNPSLPSKLLEFAGLKECNSSHLWSPADIKPVDYERISANQKREWDSKRKM